MILPPFVESVWRQKIEGADAENHKKNRDVEIGQGRLILTDSATSDRYSLTISNGGIVLQDMDGNELSTDAKIRYAEAVIADTYGDTVSVFQKKKSLLKFGRNANVSTSYVTVWEYGGDETYVTTNAIDTISSSDAGDTQDITIEGHTVTGTGVSQQFTFVTQTATLNGQNKVVLGTPLARVSRAFVEAGSTLAGDVYVYEDDTLSGGVPTTASKVHISIEGATSGHTQTFKAATTFSNGDYFICTGGYAALNKKTAGAADIVLEVRQPGGVFRPVGGRIALDSDGSSTAQINFDPYVIVPKNSDIRARAIGSAAGIEIDVSFQGYLALVV